MPYSRFNDAVQIQAGASNPIAVSRALVRAIDSVREAGGTIETDPAVRLICHQLSFLLKVPALDRFDTSDYSRALAECEARKAEATPTAPEPVKKPETAPRLLSSERAILAHYLEQSEARRAEILAEAEADPATSGPLVQMMRFLFTA